MSNKKKDKCIKIQNKTDCGCNIEKFSQNNNNFNYSNAILLIVFILVLYYIFIKK